MRQRWEMRVSSTTRVVAAVSHRGTRTISTLQGNDRHAERECQDKDHEASNPHAADALLQLACRQCSRLLGEGGGSAQRGEDLRFDTSHAVDKRCRVAVSPLDGSEWQNTRRVRLHPGKLGKPILACTSLVDSWLCGFLRVFHLRGGEGLLQTLATYHARPETKMPQTNLHASRQAGLCGLRSNVSSGCSSPCCAPPFLERQRRETPQNMARGAVAAASASTGGSAAGARSAAAMVA
eukprot:scaffold43716_cov69-Phaeocystis_antarctica.AAC.3